MNQAFSEYIDELDSPLYAEVILPLPVQKLFTYRIPAEYYELAMTGKRVFVPFGNKKVYTGIIANITKQKNGNYEALNIISIIDDTPVISDQQFEFWIWMSSYYMCGLGDIMAAALPAAMKLASESFISLAEDADYKPEELDPSEVLILEILKGKEKMKISELETKMKSKSSLIKMIKSLYERGLIILFEDISGSYKPKQKKWIRINSELDEQTLEEILNKSHRSAPKQFEVLMALLALPNREAAQPDLLKKHNLNQSSITTLVKKGVIVAENREEDRLSGQTEDIEDYTLTQEQQNSVAEIEASMKEKLCTLLFGTAASGKTFVYIELIKKTIAEGKSVLYLVPELALTHQLIDRLGAYFGSEMMVSHSRFSRNEKMEIWKKAESGEIKLLVGPRSNLFLPLQNPGLIIIDEEHENTFKQMERPPLYHARDSALVYASKCGAKVLLGTATPSVETWFNALSGKYGLVKLNSTFFQKAPAKIHFANLKEEKENKTMTGIFSSTLLTAIDENIEKGKQIILFQNRKGFVPLLECEICGWVSKCVNCDIAMTYYKYSDNLRCHYCGYQQPGFSKCSACGNHSMSIQGYGTERIVEELQLIRPELTVERFDQESTRKKNTLSTLLDRFEKGLTQVIVGTQIVAKGLDFKNVGLTAVIQADHLLNFPDFRSWERTYQLLVQLAGRAGREDGEGEMIIQTAQPDHPVFQSIQTYDTEGFLNSQLPEREQFHYPPYTRLIKLVLKSKNQNELNAAARDFAKLLNAQLGDSVLGPEIPHISKIRTFYLRNFLIKLDQTSMNPVAIKKFIQDTFDYLIAEFKYKNLRLVADPDPQ